MAVQHELEAQDHYAYVTRSAIRLFNEGMLPNVASIDVEPNYGYTTRLTYTDGSHRITYGNDLGLNPGAAEDLAKDKGHTKFLLRTIGVNCPDGQEFLLPWWAEAIGESQAKRGNTELQTTEDAFSYVDTELGYPVYVKPVAGSKGIGVQRAEDEFDLQQAFEELELARSRVAVIEQAVHMPDYRIVILDGDLISAYRRDPLSVTGDGRQTIIELLVQQQQRFISDGRDTIIDLGDRRIMKMLAAQQMSLSSVVTAGRHVTLSSISNLSAGGASVDVGSRINEHWIDLSAYVADNFNLRLCGIDLACEDIESELSDYSVLEVNSTPGLDHYASSGEEQLRIVDHLYATVLNAFPSRS